MNKDKALEDLFLAQQPHFDDNDAFMTSLQKRLDAVEYIKQHQEAAIRRYKLTMVLAFVVGLISGGVAMAYVLFMPAGVPLFKFHVSTGFFAWLAENSRLIVVTALSLLMSFGLLSIVRNISDIVNMRRQVVEN